MASLCLALPLAQTVGAAQRGTRFDFGNDDTRIVIDAGDRAPRLVELRHRDTPAWSGAGDEPLIAVATVAGVERALVWRFDPAATATTATTLVLTYASSDPPLRLRSEWSARARNGPLEHTIRIENLAAAEVWIPLQDSLHLAWHVPADARLEQLWVDKGAGSAPPVGTHRADVGAGYRWRGESSTYAHPRAGEAREIIPYLNVFDAHGARGWYAGLEFSGRTAMTLARTGETLAVVAGLNAQPGPFRTRIGAGATFATPTVFLGAAGSDVDETGNTLRRWVRAVLNDPATLRDPSYPWTTNNSWGSEMRIDDAQIRRMIADAHALGFEMFHVDAGWFRAVGDWVPDPHKFPHGLAPLADYAHSLGMRLGLWVDWAQAGTSHAPGALDVHDLRIRDWLTTDVPADWKTDQFKGLTIDIGVPAVQRHAAVETERIVHDYRLDMIEHDGYVVAQGCDRATHPHAPPDAGNTRRYVDESFAWLDGPNSTDVSYHATRAYYEIQAGLKRRHPGLLREICNDGGRMVDFGSAAHGDYFSIVDSYDPVSNRQAFYDASHVLPPAMLEDYVKEWPAPRIENLRYMLRSAMMGWFTLMLDTTRWTAAQHAAARAEVMLYKTRLRPLIREADLFHVAPRADGKGWDGIEYFDARRSAGALYAFHGSDAAQRSHAFVLRGLAPAHTYRLHFADGSSPDRRADGAALMRSGVTIELAMPDSSEIVLIDRE
ncbi:MAG: glycoside hydrolase family 36 protein [Rudaea sp.]